MKMIFSFLIPSMAVLLLSSSIFLTGFSAHPETERLIQDICHRADDFKLCNATMNANYPASQQDLPKMAISVVLEYATSTKQYVDELTAKKTDEVMKLYLGLCSDAYGVVKDSFTAAEKQFGEMHPLDALESEKKAVEPINFCDNNFSKPPTRTNILWQQNSKMKDLIQKAIIALENYLHPPSV